MTCPAKNSLAFSENKTAFRRKGLHPCSSELAGVKYTFLETIMIYK